MVHDLSVDGDATVSDQLLALTATSKTRRRSTFCSRTPSAAGLDGRFDEFIEYR